jgi:hypothetical protein
MIVILMLLLVLLIFGVAMAIFVQPARLMIVIAASILLYVPSYFVWFAIQYFQIVPVDQLMKEMFGIYTHQLVGTWLGRLVLFGPPLLPSVILLCSFLLLSKSKCGGKA